MIAVATTDASQVAEARREATTIAQQNGFGFDDAGRVALVATELATNLIKHGGGGEILLGAYEDCGRSGIELLALDRGRGMANVEACLRDGFSSAGTQGNGLGAVLRQSHLLDIASWPDVGTAVLARLEAGQPDPQRVASHSGWGAVAVPMPGEAVCGDSWTVSDNGTFARCSLPTDWAMDRKLPKLRSKPCDYSIVSMAIRWRPCSTTCMAGYDRPAALRYRSRASTPPPET
jgi:anti-sigma regulatory factor (Ser/Thr protein kinase)